jgi:hypothetical protein
MVGRKTAEDDLARARCLLIKQGWRVAVTK